MELESNRIKENIEFADNQSLINETDCKKEILQLKHLAPYLPYNTKVISTRGTVFLLDTYSNIRGKGIESRDIQSVLNDQMKLILRPLSDLNKEIDIDGEKMNVLNIINLNTNEHVNSDLTSIFGGCWEGGQEEVNILSFYSVFEILFKYHFDVFGLIDKGLAVDINELKNN